MEIKNKIISASPHPYFLARLKPEACEFFVFGEWWWWRWWWTNEL